MPKAWSQDTVIRQALKFCGGASSCKTSIHRQQRVAARKHKVASRPEPKPTYPLHGQESQFEVQCNNDRSQRMKWRHYVRTPLLTWEGISWTKLLP